MARYLFSIVISGEGNDPNEAWGDACDAFAQDPGPCPEENEILEEDEKFEEYINNVNAEFDKITNHIDMAAANARALLEQKSCCSSPKIRQGLCDNCHQWHGK